MLASGEGARVKSAPPVAPVPQTSFDAGFRYTTSTRPPSTGTAGTLKAPVPAAHVVLIGLKPLSETATFLVVPSHSAQAPPPSASPR